MFLRLIPAFLPMAIVLRLLTTLFLRLVLVEAPHVPKGIHCKGETYILNN